MEDMFELFSKLLEFLVLLRPAHAGSELVVSYHVVIAQSTISLMKLTLLVHVQAAVDDGFLQLV
jgi:hypothetical protein